MAITLDMLSGDNFKALDDPTKAAIVALSTNDENTVIASKISTIYNDLDKDVSAVLGKEKPREMKTYAWIKQELGDLKKAAESTATLTSQITALNTEKADLLKQIKEGNGDAALRAQVAKLETDIRDKENQFNGLKTQFAQTEAEKEAIKKASQQEMTELFVQMDFARQIAGRQLKPGYRPEDVQLIMKAKIPEVVGKYQRVLEDVNGQKVLRFRDENGLLVSNPKNMQQPLTIADLTEQHFGDYFAGAATGAGGGGNGGGGFTGSLKSGLDISGIKSKAALDNEIRAHLSKQGKTSSDPTYHQTMVEIRKEAIEALPKDLPLMDPA